jgi:hypothetical protein
MQETMEPVQKRTLREAIDECQRELNIRRRCFPRWVADGRASFTDAQDRLDRLQTAIDYLVLQEKVAAEPAL